MQIEIDGGSGFCFGVTTAIKKAEEELAKGTKLYCLGDIVHNSMEVERLEQITLKSLTPHARWYWPCKEELRCSLKRA